MLNISPLYLGNGLFLFLFSKPRSSTQSYFVQCSSPHTCHHVVRMGPWWEGGSVCYFPSQVPKSSSPSMCDTQCWHKYFLCRSVTSPGMSEWGSKNTGMFSRVCRLRYNSPWLLYLRTGTTILAKCFDRSLWDTVIVWQRARGSEGNIVGAKNSTFSPINCLFRDRSMWQRCMVNVGRRLIVS